MKNWPFKQHEKVQLYWIDGPYKIDSKWMIDAYFKGNNETKRVTMDWATIHFLAFGRYYSNGIMNRSEYKVQEQFIDIDLSGIIFQLVEDKLQIDINGVQIQTKVFVGYSEGIEYRIPTLEIIRAILAQNRFLLNRIVEVDTLSKYFIYEFKSSNHLHINFFQEYERKLLSDYFVKHIAWLITNRNILKMFNQVGSNLFIHNKMSFDFLFDNFNIRGRVNVKGKTIRIYEITQFISKYIQTDYITISSDHIKEIRRINVPKKREYRQLKDNDDKLLDPKADGSFMGESDFIPTSSTEHKYLNQPIINRIKTGTIYAREDRDESTQIYEIENRNIRTTADQGGFDRAKGLEYMGLDEISMIGELEDFINVLKLLNKKDGVKDIALLSDSLPEGKKGKKFSMLSDGKTKRRYVAGILKLMGGKECCLIEVEREDKALSTLLLFSNKHIDWDKIILLVTLGLVNNNGTWDATGLEKLKTFGILAQRQRHKSSRSSAQDKCDHIYQRITEVII